MLPKEVYAQLVPEEEPELFSNIVRIFKDIPENSTIDMTKRTTSSDEYMNTSSANSLLQKVRVVEHSIRLQLLLDIW